MDDLNLRSLQHPELSQAAVASIRRTLDRPNLFLKIPANLKATYQAFQHRDLSRYIRHGAPPLFVLVVGLIALNTYFYRDLLQGDNLRLWLSGSLFVIACTVAGIAAVWSRWGRRHYSAVVTVLSTLVITKLALFPSAFSDATLRVFEAYSCVLAVIVVVLALRLPFRHIIIVVLASTSLVFLLDQMVPSYQLNLVNFLYYYVFISVVCLFIAWQMDEREKTEFFQWLLIGYNMRVNAELQEKLKNQANRDSLTQIPNRRAFEETLEKEWERLHRQQQPLSLLFMDIDYFKPFNDTCGHDAGDKCLKQVALSIQASLNRPPDMVARIGGEEFVVLLPDTDAEGGGVIASRIQSQLEQLAIPHPASDVSRLVTLSIGVATIVPDSETKPKSLLKAADAALYDAKAAGRNRVMHAGGSSPAAQ